MPLVHVPGPEHAAGERRRRARKIKPQYTDGPLVRVARAANQPEAELIAVLLLEEGIPSMQKRSGGFDVPDFLAAGCVALGIGSSLVSPKILRDRNWSELTRVAAE